MCYINRLAMIFKTPHFESNKWNKKYTHTHTELLQLNEIMLHFETKRFDVWNLKRFEFFIWRKNLFKKGHFHIGSTKWIQYSNSICLFRTLITYITKKFLCEYYNNLAAQSTWATPNQSPMVWQFIYTLLEYVHITIIIIKKSTKVVYKC